MTIENIINKTHSMTFAEYLYNSIQANSTFFLMSDWGFFVNIEPNGNTNSHVINKNLVKNNKVGSLETINENRIKSFQSMSNLHAYDTIVIKKEGTKENDTDVCILNGQIITKTISLIKNNLYLLGTFALYSIGFSYKNGK